MIATRKLRTTRVGVAEGGRVHWGPRIEIPVSVGRLYG